jgi:hypothetical protein
MKNGDTIGYLFIGLTVLLVCSVLFGHTRRERFSQESSPWEAARIEVEAQLANSVDYDVGAFRKYVMDQNLFFPIMKDPLIGLQASLFTSMIMPEASQVKNTATMFDEKLRLMKEDMESLIKKGQPSDLATANLVSAGMTCMLKLARNYMLIAAVNIGVTPKTSPGLSTSLSNNLSKLFG